MKTNINHFFFLKRDFLVKSILGSFIIFAASSTLNCKAGAIDDLLNYSRECLIDKRLKNCKFAIRNAEVLQLKAGYKDNYACQTRLIGLESDLIITMLSFPRDEKSMNTLEEVKNACHSF